MTRFANLPRPCAVGILVLTLGVIVWGWCISDSLIQWSLGAHAGAPDLDFYRRVVTEIHQGRDYYDAVDASAARTGFRLTSTFHWRLPLCAWMIGSSPFPDLFFWLLLLLSGLSVIAAVRTFLLPTNSTAVLLVGPLLLMGGAFSWALYEHDAFLATEPWCEVLILFSLCAYARGWWPAGMATAVFALFLRELMLPYCLVALVLASRRGRRTEWLLWIGCLALFAIGLYFHNRAIVSRHPDLAVASTDQWLHPTGLRFVLQSGVMNIFLRGLPTWLIAIYFPLALLGLAGWPGQIGARLALSAAIYAMAFALVRADDYWGYLYTPVLVLGIMRAPAALRDLTRAVFRAPLAMPRQRII